MLDPALLHVPSVLTVQKVPGSAAAPYGRYLLARTQSADGRGDYYLNRHGRQEAPGRWALGAIGAGLMDVDTDQPVSADQLTNLLAVAFPNDAERALRKSSNGTATAAIDLTFSAPKSVSVVWALGSDATRQAIEQAHERAVDRALEHAVAHVPMLRRRIDRQTVIRERPKELLASVYRHTTARAVEGRPPDPQLHSHVLLHGAIRDDDEAAPAQAVAIESRALMVHQRELGAAYRGAFADALRELGFAIERRTGRDGRYFEIEGVPRDVVERFSSRHRQVVDRIEWRKLERLHGLRALAELDGDRGIEARARLAGVERELAAFGDVDGDNLPGVVFDLLERRDGLRELSRRLGPLGDRARLRLLEVERWGDRLSPAQERVIARESRAAKDLETHGDLDRAWSEESARLGFDSRDAEALTNGGPESSPERAALRRVTLDNLTLHKATFLPREARAVALESASSRSEAEGLLAELVDVGELLRLEQGHWTTARQRELERVALKRAHALATGRVARVDAEDVDVEIVRLRAELAAVGGLSPEQEAAIRAATSDRQLVAIQGQAGTGKSTALTASARAEAHAGRQIVVTSTGGQAAERLAHELRLAGVAAEAFSTRALVAACHTGGLRLGPDTTLIHDECALASTAEQTELFSACDDAGARLVQVGDREQNVPVGAGGLMERVESLAIEHGRFVALERIVRARDEDDREMQRALRAGDTRTVVTSLDRRDRIALAATRAEATERAAELWDRHRHGDGGALVLCESSNQHVDELNAQLQAVRVHADELGPEAIPVPGRPYALHSGDDVVVRAQYFDVASGKIRNGERATVREVENGRATLDLGEDRSISLDTAGLREADIRLAYAQHANPAQGVTTGVAIDLFGQLSTRRGQYVSLTRARDAHHLVTSYEDLDVDVDQERSVALDELAERMGRDEPEVPSIDLVELGSDRMARADAMRVVARTLGDDVAERVATATRDPDAALAEMADAEIADRARRARSRLDESGQPDLEQRHRARTEAERERLSVRLGAERDRLAAARRSADQLGRMQRKERARLDRLSDGHRKAIEDLERRLGAVPPSGHEVPRREVGELEGVEYVQVEREQHRRMRLAYDRAELSVRAAPRADLVEVLGTRPAHGPDRELWERRALQMELHRGRYGELPERADLPTPGRSRTGIELRSGARGRSRERLEGDGIALEP